MTESPGLERSHYPIPSLDARSAGASFSTYATFNGYIACSNPPRAMVESLLPPELRLADVDGRPSQRHPLIFVFGQQTRCAMVLGGVDVERDIAYDELAVLVPFVTHRRVRQLCIYVPGMASSYYLSNWTGKVHYGYGKRLAHIHDRPPIYAVTLPDVGLAFRALVGRAGAWLSAQQALHTTRLRALRSIASLPWVGRKPTGGFVRSWSDWRFDAARLREVRVRCSVVAPLVDALAPGEYLTPDEDPALQVRGMTWRLSWPQPCPF